jgi:acetyl-CoA C-acetyltransferase
MTGSNAVWVLGGYQTDFSRNWTAEGLEIDAMVAEVSRGAVEAVGIDPALVETIHVGNAFGQLFTGQGHLGAMPATVEPAWWGVPAGRHEGACASGGLAMLAAMAELEAGRYDVALVVGAEIERTVRGAVAADHMRAAAWAGHEGQDANVIWASMFSRVADEYDKRYGVDDAHLREIGRLNLQNAKDNPLAQTRTWTFEDRSFTADDQANPVVEGRLRRHDCSQITDGAAAVVLVSSRFLERHPDVARRPRSLLAGWGHRTVGLPLEQKLRLSEGEPYVLPHVREAVLHAFGRAGVASVDDLDLIETHDCFTASEYLAIDHFGITPPGMSWQAVESGDIARGGRIPVNAGGGLIGTGHPVGATGVRMVLDAHRQVTGRADAVQVEGARVAATLNVGGSTATTVCLVLRGEVDGASAE